MNQLPVSEVFGPVWQGEGPHAGKRCSFLRLGLCNLSCSWCDTPYTWDRSRFDVRAECPPMSNEMILDKLREHHTRLLVLSGGEPLVHQNNRIFEDLLIQWPWPVHVETNGTRTPTAFMVNRCQHFSVSPKLANSGDPHEKRIVPDALLRFADLAHSRQAAFKFVISDPADFAEVHGLVVEYAIPESQVWVMPEGIDPATVIEHARKIEERAADYGYNMTLRQHVLLHGNERGH